MYCPQCNTVLSENAKICTSCGASVANRNREFAPPKKSMRWYYALAFGFLPLSVLGYAYHISLCLQFGVFWLIPVSSLLALLSVNELISLVRYRKRAPKLLTWLCYLNTALFVCSSFAFYGFGAHDLIAITVYGCLIAFFNDVYFDKRSYYFEN